MKVTIYLKETSQPLVFENVANTYTKGLLYCIYINHSLIHKFPLSNIFKITEE